MTMRIKAAGVELDFSRMQLSGATLNALPDEIKAALTEMAAVEAGAKVNTDENRQVGHYWLRNPELASDEIAAAILQTWKDFETFGAETFDGRFRNILWIGIGGSGLGPQLMYDALRVPGQTPTMFFFDNTDPFGFQRTLGDIQQAGGLSQTLTVVVSKSGGTKETANGMKVAMTAYEAAGLEFNQHAAAVTQSGSALDQFAESWLNALRSGIGYRSRDSKRLHVRTNDNTDRRPS